MTTPTAGFTAPETFHSRLAFGAFLRRFVPMLVLLYLVMVLLLRGILGAFGVDRLGWPLALVLGAAGALGLVASKKRQFDETWGSTRLELSAAGATMAGRHIRVHLPWEHIRYLGAANLVATRGTVAGAGARANLLVWPVARAARGVRQAALVGVSTTTVDPGTSRLVRGQLRQNDSCREIDPVTGRRMSAIVLTVYDRDWRNGRIGEWIGAYRPDLLAQR